MADEEFSWFDRNAMALLRRLRFLNLLGLIPLFGILLLGPLLFMKVVVFNLAIDLPKHFRPLPVLVLQLPAFFLLASFLRALTVNGKLKQAYADDDRAEIGRLKRLMNGSGPPRNAFERANRLISEAELALRYEDWKVARDLFAQIDRDALPEVNRPGIMSELGLATAFLGEAKLGLTFAERALREAKATKGYPDEKMWFIKARLGIVQSLAERYDEAMDLLLDVLCTEGGELRMWSTVQFHRARVMRALGYFDDAEVHLVDGASGEGPDMRRCKRALALPKDALLTVTEDIPEEPADEPSGRRRKPD